MAREITSKLAEESLKDLGIQRRDFRDFQIEASLKAKPIEAEWGGFKGVALSYWTLDRFTIKSKKCGKTLDLVAITPDGWAQKAFGLPVYKSPEFFTDLDLGRCQGMDVDRKECFVNLGLGSENEDGDRFVSIVIWCTLAARYVYEMGLQIGEHDLTHMRDILIKRRSEVLQSLTSEDASSPQEIALESFNTKI